jgi:hypothetical protein
MRRLLIGLSLALLALVATGDGLVLAARCTPLGQGVCRACSTCNYCGHCAKGGGRCTVCK